MSIEDGIMGMISGQPNTTLPGRQPGFISKGAGADSVQIELDGQLITNAVVAWFLDPFYTEDWETPAPGSVVVQGDQLELLEGQLRFIPEESYFKHWQPLHQGLRRIPMVDITKPLEGNFKEWLQAREEALRPPEEG